MTTKNTTKIWTRDIESFTAIDRCPLTPRQLLYLSQSFENSFSSEFNLHRRLRQLTKAGYAMKQDDPAAFNFFMAIIEKYKRDRAGYQDRIVISQLSGNNKSLLFDGRTGDLKKAFSSQEQFKDYLLRSANDKGSNVYASIDRTLSYLTKRIGIDQDTTQITIILSDLMDNSASSDTDRAAMIETMKEYCTNGTFGLYWVDESQMDEWGDIMREVGFDPVPLWTRFHYMPPLPNFINR